jgi:hypothetical protein
VTTREKPVVPDDARQVPPHGIVCPECHGTGFVFVMPDDADVLPLKRQGANWAKSTKRLCGVCGGDGRIDEWDIGGHPNPADWYMHGKRKQIG